MKKTPDMTKPISRTVEQEPFHFRLMGRTEKLQKRTIVDERELRKVSLLPCKTILNTVKTETMANSASSTAILSRNKTLGVLSSVRHS